MFAVSILYEKSNIIHVRDPPSLSFAYLVVRIVPSHPRLISFLIDFALQINLLRTMVVQEAPLVSISKWELLDFECPLASFQTLLTMN